MSYRKIKFAEKSNIIEKKEIFCKNCGSKIDKDFCPKCGKKIIKK